MEGKEAKLAPAWCAVQCSAGWGRTDPSVLAVHRLTPDGLLDVPTHVAGGFQLPTCPLIDISCDSDPGLATFSRFY